jgi:hypothetical protein
MYRVSFMLHGISINYLCVNEFMILQFWKRGISLASTVRLIEVALGAERLHEGNGKARTMDTNHTPGPWTYSMRGITAPNGQRVEADGLALVTGVRDKLDPAFANAHLIAAAPELYAALSGLVADYDNNQSGINEGLVKMAKAALAKAALAKARGETEG